MAKIPILFKRFFLQDLGGSYLSASFALLTIAISIPLGIAFLHIYLAICAGGRGANLILGQF